MTPSSVLMLLVGLGSGARKITGSGTVAAGRARARSREDQLRPGILEPHVHVVMPRLQLRASTAHKHVNTFVRSSGQEHDCSLHPDGS